MIKKTTVQNFLRALAAFHFFAIFLSFTTYSSEKSIQSGSVSIGFDDGYETVYQYALPLFKKYKMAGTAYITTGAVGQPGYMSWEQIHELENEGWEIAAHSVNHPVMEKMSVDEAKNEALQSLKVLQDNGFKDVNGFAFPYGSYTWQVIAELAKSFHYLRGFWDRADLNPPDTLNRDLVRVQAIDRKTSLEKIKEWVTKAKEERKGLSLVLHDLEIEGQIKFIKHLGMSPTEKPGEYLFSFDVNALEQSLKIIEESGLPVVTDRELVKFEGKPILYSTFTLPSETLNSSNLTQKQNDWITGSAIQFDQNDHGSYPRSIDSIVANENTAQSVDDFTVISKKIEIRSKINEEPLPQYLFQGYFNLTNMTEGTWKVEAQELNSKNEIVNKVTLEEIPAKIAFMLRRPYQPKDKAASHFRIAIYPQGIKGRAYLDELILIQK